MANKDKDAIIRAKYDIEFVFLFKVRSEKIQIDLDGDCLRGMIMVSFDFCEENISAIRESGCPLALTDTAALPSHPSGNAEIFEKRSSNFSAYKKYGKPCTGIPYFLYNVNTGQRAWKKFNRSALFFRQTRGFRPAFRSGVYRRIPNASPIFPPAST